jgi:hypothetical protein
MAKPQLAVSILTVSVWSPVRQVLHSGAMTLAVDILALGVPLDDPNYSTHSVMARGFTMDDEWHPLER